MVFPVVMYGCENWTVKKAECQRIDAFKLWCWRRLESPLDYEEIQPVHSEDQPWDFFGRNDAKAENPVFWPHHAKSWLIGKDSDAGRDWGQEEKGTPEDEMAGWHHWLDGLESEWTPGVCDGQGGLACSIHGVSKCRTQLSDWTELMYVYGASQMALVINNPPANAGDLRDVGSIPKLRRSPGERHGNPLQCSCLENLVDRGAWRATVHRVAKSRTRLKWVSMHTFIRIADSLCCTVESNATLSSNYTPIKIN